MKIAGKRTKLFIYLWPALGMTGALHYCSNPLSLRLYEIYVKKRDSANVSKILPIKGWFPWDIDQYYGYSYFIELCGVMGCCIGSVSYDQLYVSTLLIISSQLKFLSSSLQCKAEIPTRIRYRIRITDFFYRRYQSLRFESLLNVCWSLSRYVILLQYEEKLNR